MTQLRKPQLQMILRPSPTHRKPNVWDQAVPDGYRLRTYRDDDAESYLRLMNRAGFEDWDESSVAEALAKSLPNGIFFLEPAETGRPVATAAAFHAPTDLHPFGGELGWVGTHPDHRDRGLGRMVCAAAVDRLVRAEYERIYLITDEWRLPAIKIYLGLGFVPFLFAPEMKERWRAVCRELDWPFTPREWPAVSASD